MEQAVVLAVVLESFSMVVAVLAQLDKVLLVVLQAMLLTTAVVVAVLVLLVKTQM